MRFVPELFRLAAPAPLPAQLAAITALQLHAQAERAAREESFQRSDTDGFLTQWAAGLSAQKADEQAAILAQGGYANFLVLIEEATGKIISTETQKYTWGTLGAVSSSWVLNRDQQREYSRFSIPHGAKRSRVQVQLGLVEVERWYPAQAVVEGRGTGLSGTCWVCAAPLPYADALALSTAHAAAVASETLPA